MLKRTLKDYFIPRVKSLAPKLKEIERSFLTRGKRSPFRGRQPSLTQKITLIVPTYNVEKYFNEFMLSVVNQSTGLQNVEIIVVDDGSTDSSGEIARKWQTAYPKSIKYIYQKNKGLSGARNTGLQHVTGDWVSFPDPDDILDRHYFHFLNVNLNKKREIPLALLGCNLVLYYELNHTHKDNHPLNYKFKKQYNEKNTDDLGDCIHLSAASSFFNVECLKSSGLKFEAKIKPTFEDAYLINRLFTMTPNHAVGFIKGSIYNYRKREDQTSLVGGANSKPEWYIDQLRFGYLELLRKTQQLKGFVPKYIQRTVLYDISWRFTHLKNNPERTKCLTSEQLNEFQVLLREIFEFIDVETIRGMSVHPLNEENRIGLLNIFKSDTRGNDYLYVTSHDKTNNFFQFSVYSANSNQCNIDVFVNGMPAKKIDPSCRRSKFLKDTYSIEHRFWTYIPENGEFRATIEGRPADVRRGGKSLGARPSHNRLKQILKPAVPKESSLTNEALSVREYSRSSASQLKFSNCWVLMDRDDAADDNAEHLYRYLMKNGKADKAYYVLRKESSSWQRLKDEGFQLLDFGSDDHIAAVVNSQILASSHAADFVLWPCPKQWIQDLTNYNFVFLQHGVTKDDLSLVVGSRPYRLFITTARREYESIANFESNYHFSEREVRLTGFPRHDALLAGPLSDEIVLIIPTWRKYLSLTNSSKGAMSQPVDNFLESDFAIAWRDLLNDPRLKSMANRNNKQVVFCPHPNLTPYLAELDLPEWVSVVNPVKLHSFQELFKRASVLVTDYSSVAMETAYINKPAVYFQFDRNDFFNSSHGYRAGYFDYYNDGFGPVSETTEQTLNAIECAIEGVEDPIYSERRNQFFEFRDGLCCERVYKAIMDLI